MKRTGMLFGVLFMGAICANTAYAQTEPQQQCEAKATEKNLIGDVKADYIKACVKTLNVADKAGQCEQAAADKKLSGAAKTSYIEKCVKTLNVADKAGQCEQAAADKKLSGAAKTSYVEKCLKDSTQK